MTAYFVVRAKVADPDLKDDFERWYRQEHLPDAQKGFNSRRAWRGWSAVEPLVHYAYYEFDDVAQVRAIQSSEVLKSLVAEFDRVWGNRVTRTRDVVEVVHTLAD
jgi:hypothetical protein